jgi:hypothetical protein
MVTVDRKERIHKVSRDARPEVTYTIPEGTLMDLGGVVFEQKNGGVQGYLRTRQAALTYYYDIERQRDNRRTWAQQAINNLNYDEAQGRVHDMYKYPILDPEQAFAELTGHKVVTKYVQFEPMEGKMASNQYTEPGSITMTVDDMLRDELRKQQFAEEVARKKALLANFGVDDFEDGQILSFPKRLPNSRKDEGYQTYLFAAIKAAGRWYLTGSNASTLPTALDWADLVIWLIEGDWPTKAVEVGLATFRAQDDLASHAKQSRAIEAKKDEPEKATGVAEAPRSAKVVEGTYNTGEFGTYSDPAVRQAIKDNP